MCDLRQCTPGDYKGTTRGLQGDYKGTTRGLQGDYKVNCYYEAKLHPRLTDLLKCVVAFPSADLSHYLLTAYWIWSLQL